MTFTLWRSISHPYVSSLVGAPQCISYGYQIKTTSLNQRLDLAFLGLGTYHISPYVK